MHLYLTFYYLCQINSQKIMKMLRYFYYPDHASTWLNTSIGISTSTGLSNLWITDGTGQAIQHLHYLPFGEDWVDQRNSSWNTPYTFSGKEKDVETGYGYFGARYYDSGLSVWLSVDPLSDKYPTLSPYTYCANNPIMMVDPDGNTFTLYSKGQEIQYTLGMPVPENASKDMADMINGLNYLYNNPQGNSNYVEEISNSDQNVFFECIESGSSTYSGTMKHLKWNNKEADVFSDGGVQSAIIGLAHEIKHTNESVKGWEDLISLEDQKIKDTPEYSDALSRAYSYSDDPRATQWENDAMGYENFIGGKKVDGKPLSTHLRTGHYPPEKSIKVNSIFSLE